MVIHIHGAPAEPCQTSLPTLLPRLRLALESQRDFRTDQLARFNASERSSRPASGASQLSPAVQEVQAMVVAGARRALSDIELSLARMRAGNYGQCRECGDDISTSVLLAIPLTTLCLACQRQEGCTAGGRWPGEPISACAHHRTGPRSAGQKDRVDQLDVERDQHPAGRHRVRGRGGRRGMEGQDPAHRRVVRQFEFLKHHPGIPTTTGHERAV
jgi:RNA polymerase-binding transcription factor DksA